MSEPLFSDIPVGGGSNFQGRVDQMCEEINKTNAERSDEEKGIPVQTPPVEEVPPVEVPPVVEVKPVEVTPQPVVEEDDTLKKMTT